MRIVNGEKWGWFNVYVKNSSSSLSLTRGLEPYWFSSFSGTDSFWSEPNSDSNRRSYSPPLSTNTFTTPLMNEIEGKKIKK
jgi:hypothetical protein